MAFVYQAKKASVFIGISIVGVFVLGWAAAAGAADPAGNAHPQVVANFYFAGTFGTGKGWDYGFNKKVAKRKEYMPWGTPALWEAMWKYPKHMQAFNEKKLYTYHRLIPGVAAWETDAYGDRPHCLGNPRGWEEVHGNAGPGQSMYYWLGFLADVYARRHELELPDDYKIIVNIGGQSRGGMSAIRFAGEIIGKDGGGHNPANLNRIAWINVVVTDPVWDENPATGDEPCWGDDTNINYTRYKNFKLGEKVRNYVGIYAEDERSTDFWPIIPFFESSNTNVVLLTVPGSHQTLVGNYQSDGHIGKHWYHGRDSQHDRRGPLWSHAYKWYSAANASWQSLQYAVTYMVLHLYGSSDFGFTEFKTGDDDGDPNYLRWCLNAIENNPDHLDDHLSWKAHMQTGMDAGRQRVRSVSFLPKGSRGKLMAWWDDSDKNDRCVEILNKWEVEHLWFDTKPRCSVKATGEAPSADNTYGEGLEKGPFDSTFIPDLLDPDLPPHDRWLEIKPILDSAESYTIEASASGGCVISPIGQQDVPFDTNAEFTVGPGDGDHYLKGINVDGDSKVWQEDVPYTFENVRRDHSIKPVCGDVPPFMITASASEGGQIYPNGVVEVQHDPPQDVSFTIVGTANNMVAEVLIDLVSTGPLNVPYYKHTFNGVADNHTIEASFVKVYRLLVEVSPQSAGRVDDAVPPASPSADGIDCADSMLDDCRDPIYPGGYIDLVPTAEDGYKFTGWTGCDVQPAPGPSHQDSCRMEPGPDPPLPFNNQAAVYANFISDSGGADPDGDGVPTTVEMAAPNSGDGNFDGVPDAEQSAVASFVSPKTGRYCTIDLLDVYPGQADTLVGLVVGEAGDFAADPDHVYPLGVVSLVVTDFHFEVGVGVRFIVHGLADASRYSYVYRRLNQETLTWETVPANITSYLASSPEAYTVFEYEFYPSPASPSEISEVGGPALADSDGDGIADSIEEQDEGTNPFAEDSDGDGLSDAEELDLGTSPGDEDSNGDGVKDGDQIAAGGDPTDPNPDGDGMSSHWEVFHGLDPLVDDALLDPDGDGYSNIEEYQLDRHPLVNDEDEDGDGMPSEWEAQYRPMLDYEVNDASGDADEDGITNLEEYKNGTDPTKPYPVELQRFTVE